MKKEKIWNIGGLNCFQIHTIEALLSKRSVIQNGTAIAPDGRRLPHTWFELNGKIVDVFNWTEHEPKRYFKLPSKEYIDEWIRTAKGYCDYCEREYKPNRPSKDIEDYCKSLKNRIKKLESPNSV